MHAKDLSYQLVIARHERWISNVWLILSPVRMVGYFKCVPVFLGKTQRAAWCPQQLALNSWQLLHLPLRRAPALHQGLVSCRNLTQNLPWRMTLTVGEETFSKGTHIRRAEKEVLPVRFKWLLGNRLKPLWCGHPWVRWGLGSSTRTCAGWQGSRSPSPAPAPEHEVGGAGSGAALPFLASTSVRTYSYIEVGLMLWTCECKCLSQICW